MHASSIRFFDFAMNKNGRQHEKTDIFASMFDLPEFIAAHRLWGQQQSRANPSRAQFAARLGAGLGR
ncbi:hypothetical protein UNDKW_0141 [Undibacterium sp. KW1]|nr:hypothetical protein UNDKW_0141 [Undibacterium sp. KW1]